MDKKRWLHLLSLLATLAGTLVIDALNPEIFPVVCGAIQTIHQSNSPPPPLTPHAID